MSEGSVQSRPWAEANSAQALGPPQKLNFWGPNRIFFFADLSLPVVVFRLPVVPKKKIRLPLNRGPHLRISIEAPKISGPALSEITLVPPFLSEIPPPSLTLEAYVTS